MLYTVDEAINDTLALYGATYDGEIISPKGNRTQVKIEIKRGRARFVTLKGNTLLMSAPSFQISMAIQKLVEQYWFWKKV